MVPEMSINHDHSSGLENGLSKRRAQKEWKVRVPHSGASRKVQSDNLTSYPPISTSMRSIMFQRLRETGILLWPERHISVARTAADGTFVTGMNVGNVSDRARHESASDRTFTATASPPSLSSCGLELLTVAHQALMMVSASISLGNVEVKRHPLHVFPRALSFTHSAASFYHCKSDTLCSQSSSALNRVGALLIRSRNAATTRVTVSPRVLYPKHPHTCHLQ
jgi:hypothetical protein